MTADADAVIVGSGPAGATVAETLTAAGWHVVLLEKGRNHLVTDGPPWELRDEFANDELRFHRRHFLGPDPLLEPRSYRRGPEDGERLVVGEVNNVPATVGGGGIHADAKLPRFRAEDFRLRSERGPVEGAAVEDWPLDYDELEPFYAAAERSIGVAGDHTANPFAAWRSGPYPMPPGPDMFGARISAAAARRLGLHPYRAPTGINSVPYDGRPACNNCGFCGGYGCPIHAKGDPVGPLLRALRTGRCQLRAEAHVTDILVDGSGGRSTGVAYTDPAGRRHEVRARWVVLAAGAFETPRLLLLNELGGSSGLLGRTLTYHFQTFVVGIFPFELHGERGRAVTHLHDDFLVPDGDARAAARAAGLPWFRGGVVEHGAAAGPILEALTAPRGADHWRHMVASPLRRRLWVLTMQGEDLPQATNRIDLDPGVRDVLGRPAGRVTYRPHRHEVAASAHYAPLLEAVLREAGAEVAFTSTSPALGDPHPDDPFAGVPASRHVMGTCRMGPDPAGSVVDGVGRLWDVPNVVVADSSTFVTASGYNPTLTIVALARRAATAMLAGG